MIPQHDFRELHLTDLIEPAHVVFVDNWMFFGKEWVGELYPLVSEPSTEWLRSKEDPQWLRLIHLHLLTFPNSLLTTILSRLQISVSARMPAKQLRRLLGKPDKISTIGSIGEMQEFAFAGEYRLFCTVIREELIDVIIYSLY